MLTIQANAKINLYLDIMGVLENGYHKLAMIMQSISLCDTLFIKPSDALEVECPGVLQEENSAYLAARRFFSKAGLFGGARIRIIKRIPAKAGLGGGSADAAAALMGLNHLYGRPLSSAQLAEIAMSIGADVPFFLEGGCRQCLGIGEILSPLANNLPGCFLVVQPEQGVSTPQAYQKYDEIGGSHGSLARCRQALALGDFDAFAGATANSLERAAVALCPGIAQALEFLRQFTPCAFMTGSGSACVGLFLEEGPAQAALSAAKKRFPFAQIARSTKNSLTILG